MSEDSMELTYIEQITEASAYVVLMMANYYKEASEQDRFVPDLYRWCGPF